MTKILCIGEALIDMICTDKGKSLADGANFLKKPGGAPTNVAAAIAALGGQADLACKVGMDPFGQHLVFTMQQMGVDTRYMFRDADHFTTIAFVSLMENGERDFVFSRGADSQLSIKDMASVPLDEFDIFHFGSATSFLPGPFYEAYRSTRDKAVQQGAYISFDPNYRHDLFKNNQDFFISNSLDFIANCHYFKVSEEEAMLLTGTATLSDATTVLMEKSAATFTITLGKEGTMLCHNKETAIIKSIEIKPVDTTGAGDAFVGALLYLLAQKGKNTIQQLDFGTWKTMVYNANKAGARTCEYLGAMEAFKHLNNSIFE
ncbi:MAG: carbohydrate kinase [Chitinophagaceae bacterium]